MSQRFCVVFLYMWLTIRNSHILNWFECNCHPLEKTFFFPQNIYSCPSSIYAAAEQVSLSRLPDTSQNPDLFPELHFGHRISFRRRKAFTPVWLVIAWGRLTQNTPARDRITHTAEHMGGSDSEDTIKRKGNSQNKTRTLCDKGCLKQKCQGVWLVFFFYHCSSCLYLNTC